VPVDETLYPVNLVLRGRRCLVVGGGGVAFRKVTGLVAAGAVVHVVGRWVGEGIRQLAVDPANAVTFEERPYRPDDIEGAWLIITATDDPAVNATVRADGEAARVWVNAADDPPSCSFTLPAVVRQGPVMVTVSTAGQSPALATWLKAHVGEKMGPEFATLAGLLGEARAALQAEGRSTEDVNWRPALNWDMLGEIRAGDLARARKRLEACLSSSLD
jgi:precorrin-2 dehydrogenase/sirohydrochlorin ferrochelatase